MVEVAFLMGHKLNQHGLEHQSAIGEVGYGLYGDYHHTESAAPHFLRWAAYNPSTIDSCIDHFASITSVHVWFRLHIPRQLSCTMQLFCTMQPW